MNEYQKLILIIFQDSKAYIRIQRVVCSSILHYIVLMYGTVQTHLKITAMQIQFVRCQDWPTYTYIEKGSRLRNIG